MSRWLVGFALGILLMPIAAEAYSRSLTPEEIHQAIEYGKTRREKDLVERGHPNFLTLTGGEVGVGLAMLTAGVDKTTDPGLPSRVRWKRFARLSRGYR